MCTQMMEKLILPSEMCVTHDRTAFRCRSNKEILPLHLHKLHPHISSVHRPFLVGETGNLLFIQICVRTTGANTIVQHKKTEVKKRRCMEERNKI